MSEMITKEEVETFNILCKKLITVGYANLETFHHEKENISIGYFLMVKSLRNMTKKQIKSLLYNIGLKQVMRISCIATRLSLDSIIKNDYESKDSPWKIILEGIQVDGSYEERVFMKKEAN